jgi:Na+:H+ antiporter, NhaA family
VEDLPVDRSPVSPGTEQSDRRRITWFPLAIERFFKVEASSGTVLLMAAGVAVAWANSPWSSWYERIWATPLAVAMGRLKIMASPAAFVNDGLMTVFFLVVGAEVRREFREGALSDLRRATLPVAAAVGGMIAPALIYWAWNEAPVPRRGWGIPTATDIAFSVGVLALLGKRVPPALRVLLLALATVDDIGSVLVVSVFYPTGGAATGFIVAAGGTLGMLALRVLGIRSLVPYALPGLVTWLGLHWSGVEPALSGIPIGLLLPVERAEFLHPWVAYGVVPLFALANTGLRIDGLSWHDKDTVTVMAGVVIGRILGKPIGILTASFVTVKAGVCRLPRGVNWRGILVIGCLGGIGLTVPIYIAAGAFASSSLLASAKFALLASAVVSGMIGLLVGMLCLPGAATVQSGRGFG